jgi:hypothetical protein
MEKETREIPLSQNKAAIVDSEDYGRLTAMGKWNAYKAGNSWYAKRHALDNITGKRCTIQMHRIIMAPSTKEDHVDHINGNGLDNRKKNLRIVTHRQNHQNRHQKRSSVFPGVSWDKLNRKWRAMIQIGGRTKHLGRFTIETDAFVAYKKAVHALGEKVVLSQDVKEYLRSYYNLGVLKHPEGKD